MSFLVSEAQANSWLSSEQAFLQTLDKITARIATVPITLNQPFQFGTLEIELKHCAFTPPEVPPEAAAFLEIRDVGFVDYEKSDKITVFSGWMFASSPAVSSLEHPVYDVTLLACAK
ncbi:MAG: cellulase-like protein [Rhodospirillaceae bacterium]|nr:cellulase-like protein [Rhodospirillaceae bacterium]